MIILLLNLESIQWAVVMITILIQKVSSVQVFCFRPGNFYIDKLQKLLFCKLPWYLHPHVAVENTDVLITCVCRELLVRCRRFVKILLNSLIVMLSTDPSSY